MIFFSDMYNLMYYKIYGNDTTKETMNEYDSNLNINNTNNIFLYNNWKDFLILKEQFLLDISNIIYNYHFNYKISPSHSQNNLGSDIILHNNNETNDNSNNFYYMCNCNETFRKEFQIALSKLVYHHNKEWINNISIMITHETSYLLNRIKELRREIRFDIYDDIDDIENQNSNSEILKSNVISSSKLLYNSIYEILFKNELIKEYNSIHNSFCKYCCEENGIIISNMCYDCYFYIEVSNYTDNV